MIPALSPNTQAILLLTAPLLPARRRSAAAVFTSSEYNSLARRLRELNRQPADLLTEQSANPVLPQLGTGFDVPRIRQLLDRGFLLGQAVEHWNARAIWAISRADPDYPARWKSHLREAAPPILYGCGCPALLQMRSFAIVGSRETTDAQLTRANAAAKLAAEARFAVVSGGAAGIDQAAVRGAVESGGSAIEILPDSLDRAVLARERRKLILENRLVVASPNDPSVQFQTALAMHRNRLIYAIADAALVVTCRRERGGTWAGATEQLASGRNCPLFGWPGADAGEGNDALIMLGAQAWPVPSDAAALDSAISAARNAAANAASQGRLPIT